MDTPLSGNGNTGISTTASDSRKQSLWIRYELIVSLHSLLRIRNKEVDRDEEISRLADVLRRSKGGVEGKFGDLAEIREDQQGRTSLDKAVWREFLTLTDELRQEALKAERKSGLDFTWNSKSGMSIVVAAISTTGSEDNSSILRAPDTLLPMRLRPEDCASEPGCKRRRQR